MQRHEGLVTVTNMLLLLLTLFRTGSLAAVPPYQGQGLRSYVQFLWGLWKVVEPPKIRFVRAVVLPSTASAALWLTIGVAVATRCFVLASRGVLKIIRGAWATLMSAVSSTGHSGLWVVYVVAVAVGLMMMIPVVCGVKAVWSWVTAKIQACTDRKKA